MDIDRTMLADDIKFLLSFAPAESPDEVAEGLHPSFYITGSYEGDKQLVQRIAEIKSRYDIEEGISFEEAIGDI